MGSKKNEIDDGDFFKEIEKYNRKREKLMDEIKESLKDIEKE